jgi:uncharacterized membrane protein HdeD (DUF308 family)
MLRAVALLLLGVVALAWPGLTLAVLSAAFAAYLLFAGVANLVSGVTSLATTRMWFLDIVVGVVEVGVAAYALKHDLSAATLILVVGFFLLGRGILEVIAAFDSADLQHRNLALFVGALSIVAGFAILRHDASGGVAFAWVLGVYALVAGAVNVSVALRSRIAAGVVTA